MQALLTVVWGISVGISLTPPKYKKMPTPYLGA